MTTLSDVQGVNKYCGPAVLAALTGESTDRCAAVISRISGKNEIKAVNRQHLKEVLKALKFDVEETQYGGATLYGTLFRMHSVPGKYVVFVPHHIVAVEVKENQIYICDNHTKTPIDIKQSARLSQKVEIVWRVFPHPLPVFVSSHIEVIREYPTKIGIWKISIYKNPEDNTKESLGYIRHKDNEELKDIIRLLKESVEFGDWE
jgi:hypothetical protein